MCRCPDGRIRLMCKGADGVILERLAGEQKLLASVQGHLEEMSQAGLRTLCVAEKEISEDDFASWMEQWHAASVAMEDREEKIATASDAIEKDMELLGATAVEDKLQDGVPEAVDALVSSGIKVWVMTGDKIGTAISIANSCRLFSPGMPLVILKEQDFEDAVNQAAGAASGERCSVLSWVWHAPGRPQNVQNFEEAVNHVAEGESGPLVGLGGLGSNQLKLEFKTLPRGKASHTVQRNQANCECLRSGVSIWPMHPKHMMNPSLGMRDCKELPRAPSSLHPHSKGKDRHLDFPECGPVSHTQTPSLYPMLSRQIVPLRGLSQVCGSGI
ncbi:hypothetical protein DUNSADRAFT_2442 [Dunaliella salina]|uniref:Uncharacterized protein n=1 Tax=Dunaliella salina TaxID=3046 RepID=A0ABQ7GVN8_DUNSA|nr:hypothetical protein DUNSADRAFT_2442 [Dunaliella salina]|eukprot:KAF5838678.1 hypothetical protein DUNSADRAFT_2442 [Dunaliella salina]